MDTGIVGSPTLMHPRIFGTRRADRASGGSAALLIACFPSAANHAASGGGSSLSRLLRSRSGRHLFGASEPSVTQC